MFIADAQPRAFINACAVSLTSEPARNHLGSKPDPVVSCLHLQPLARTRTRFRPPLNACLPSAGIIATEKATSLASRSTAVSSIADSVVETPVDCNTPDILTATITNEVGIGQVAFSPIPQQSHVIPAISGTLFDFCFTLNLQPGCSFPLKSVAGAEA